MLSLAGPMTVRLIMILSYFQTHMEVLKQFQIKVIVLLSNEGVCDEIAKAGWHRNDLKVLKVNK